MRQISLSIYTTELRQYIAIFIYKISELIALFTSQDE